MLHPLAFFRWPLSGSSMAGRASLRRLAALMGILLLTLCGLLATGAARAADDFLDPEAAFAESAAMVDPLTLDMHWRIAPGYYMYQDRFEVRIEDARGGLLLFRRSDLTPADAESRTPAWADALRLPRGRIKYDPTFEKDMEVFHGGVTLRAALRPLRPRLGRARGRRCPRPRPRPRR